MADGYSPFSTGDIYYSYYSLGAFDGSSPIMEGVSELADYYRSMVTLKDGATLVASYTDGVPLVAWDFGGKVVGINMYLGVYIQATGDYQTLIYNALMFASGEINQYTVTTTATNGTITSPNNPIVNHGDTTTVTGSANAGYYFTGVSGCGGTPQTNTNQTITTFSYTTGAIISNCTVSATFAVKDGPDLNGTWQSLTGRSFGSRYLVRGSLLVSNTGNQGAGRFTITYYLSDDGVILGSVLRTGSVFRLNAGATGRMFFSYFATESLQGRYIIAVIDSGGVIAETDEKNNLVVGRLN